MNKINQYISDITLAFQSLKNEISERDKRELTHKRGQDFIKYITKNSQLHHPIYGLIPFEPYDFQKDTVEFLLTPPQNGPNLKLINSSRQMGKTILLSEYLHWRAKTSLIPIKTQLLYNNYAMAKCIHEMHTRRYTAKPKHLSINFDNNSTMEFVTKIDYSDCSDRECPDILLIDEMAYRSYGQDDTLQSSINHILRLGGEVICVSSPNLTKGLFYDLWCSADAERLQLPWWLHPERNHKWAKETRENIGNRSFSTAYLCQFVDGGDVK
jgi:hypothetical protein